MTIARVGYQPRQVERQYNGKFTGEAVGVRSGGSPNLRQRPQKKKSAVFDDRLINQEEIRKIGGSFSRVPNRNKER